LSNPVLCIFLRSAGRGMQFDPSGRVEHLIISFGSTKPPAHSEDRDGFSPEKSENFHISTRLSAQENLIRNLIFKYFKRILGLSEKPWLRRLRAEISPRRPGFNTRPVHFHSTNAPYSSMFCSYLDKQKKHENLETKQFSSGAGVRWN
jgi:hypothetical protein